MSKWDQLSLVPESVDSGTAPARDLSNAKWRLCSVGPGDWKQRFWYTDQVAVNVCHKPIVTILVHPMHRSSVRGRRCKPPPISLTCYWFYAALPGALASRVFSPPTLTLICLGLASAFLASLIFSTPWL
jgi:hypothetical protein